jgi:hypothetical protein
MGGITAVGLAIRLAKHAFNDEMVSNRTSLEGRLSFSIKYYVIPVTPYIPFS